MQKRIAESEFIDSVVYDNADPKAALDAAQAEAVNAMK